MENPFLELIYKIEENKKEILRLQDLMALLTKELKHETYLSPEEARKMFRPVISTSTLHRWQKKGLVKRHFIGKKVCYKLSEIEEEANRIAS